MYRQSNSTRAHCAIATAGPGSSWITWKHWDTAAWTHIKNQLREDFDATFDPNRRAWRVEAEVAELAAWAGLFFSPSQISTSLPRQSRVSEIEIAFDALFLKPTAPLWAVEAVHRAAVRQYHPDRGEGGDTATMARVNAAVGLIKEVRR